MRENSNISTLHTVDISTVAAQLEYYFANQPLLEGAVVRRIAVRKTGAYTERGLTVPDIIDRAFLEFKNTRGDVIMKGAAALFFIDTDNPSYDTLPIVSLKNVDWAKTRIYFPNGTTVVGGNALSVVFDYQKVAA